jgi:glutaryl-CoA dehydrogenase/cyclohexanecarboxylate-CoA ligase
MQEYLAGKGLAKQYWPERLEVMDSLPTTPSGKIQKFQLRRKIGDDA